MDIMLFEYQNRKILYTGDFSLTHTPLTDGCMIPEYEGIDTITANFGLILLINSSIPEKSSWREKSILTTSYSKEKL